MTKYAFLDTETTGLDDGRHSLLEVAAIVDDGVSTEYFWGLKPTDSILRKADPSALRLNGFYERGNMYKNDYKGIQDWRSVARVIAHALAGAHLVGLNPDFDARFLERFLRQYGQAPAWHYRTIDVSTLVMGYLIGQGEDITYDNYAGSSALLKKVGAEIPEEDRHTALGDAKLVRQAFYAVHPQIGA